MKIEYTNLQKWYGLMRVAELLSIAKAASEMKADAYVSIGCGAGCDFQTIYDHYKNIPMLGFDRKNISSHIEGPKVQFHKEVIFIGSVNHMQILPSYTFTESVSKKILDFSSSIKGPVLYYTDNGNKLSEMKQLIKWVKSGDVLGTHDWSDSLDHKTAIGSQTEVEEKDCVFLYQLGFEVFKPIQKWIVDNKCMQRFWIKN